MKERELRDGVRREDVLEADVLRVIAQALSLVLSCRFLKEPVRHLEIGAAEIEHAAEAVVGVKLVIESEERFARASEVVEVVECWWIEITLRRAG